jgi:hypothetical protein
MLFKLRLSFGIMKIIVCRSVSVKCKWEMSDERCANLRGHDRLIF